MTTTVNAWEPGGDELAAVEAEHRARVVVLDPLVAVPDLGAAPGDDRLLAVRLPDSSRAVGVLAVGDVPADSPAATFRALREHRLRARAAGPDVTAAVGALVDAWVARVRRAPGTAPESDGLPQRGPAPRDHGLSLLWPSRDAAAVAALAARGLRPTTHLAARRGAAPTGFSAEVPHGVLLEDATPADVDAVLDHQLDELAYDELVGAARRRPAARERLRAEVAGAVASPGTTVLVARAGPGRRAPGTSPAGGTPGDVLGVVAVEPPHRAVPVAGTVTAGPVAYVVLLHVAPDVRGGGARTCARRDRAGRRRAPAPRGAQPAVGAVLGAPGVPPGAHDVGAAGRRRGDRRRPACHPDDVACPHDELTRHLRTCAR
jgi:hypothetical protein